MSNVNPGKAMTNDPPACLGPQLESAAPAYRVPAGTWDTHFHPLGPAAKFPFASARRYTPPDAPFEDAVELHDRLGIDRGFVVHANTHGLDNSVFLDALDRSEGRYLGVLRLTDSLTAIECGNLHDRGVRGARFAFNPAHGGDLDRAEVEAVIKVIAKHGWFIEFHLAASMLEDLSPWFAQMPVDVVIDHIGRVDTAQGTSQPEFNQLLKLARHRHIWVKISGADRISSQGAPYHDVAPFTRRLAEVASDRMVWGTDWPHTGYFENTRFPSDKALLDALPKFLPSTDLQQAVLVENPLRLAQES